MATNQGKEESGLKILKKCLKFFSWFVLVTCLFIIAGCSGKKKSFSEEEISSEEKTLFLDVPTSIEADANGNVTIDGKTLPDTDVKIGLGIVGDSATSDKEGNFTLEYNLPLEDESSTIKITAKKDGDKKAKSVKVEPNSAKIASQKAASSSSESIAKASESSASSAGQAEQTKIEAVAQKYTTSYTVVFKDYSIIYLINEKTKTIVMISSDDSKSASTSQYTGDFNSGIDFNMDGLAMHAHYKYVDIPNTLIIADERGNVNAARQADPAHTIKYYRLYK
jgi:hypothetical protein